MPLFTATVFPPGDFHYDTEVHANNMWQAKSLIANRDGVDETNVSNCRQVDDEVSSSSSSSGGGLDVGSTGALVILGGGLLAFFTLTPFIMSGLLGAAGTWGAGKATNYSLQEYADTKNPSDNESKKALTILVSAVVLGTIGFGWGSNIQKGFSDNSTNTSMIENIRKA